MGGQHAVGQSLIGLQGTPFQKLDSSLAQKRPLLEPLFHIRGEVFKPAQGSHIDLHMLAMFFHDRQIERNLVERVRTIYIDDNHHTPRARRSAHVTHRTLPSVCLRILLISGAIIRHRFPHLAFSPLETGQ